MLRHRGPDSRNSARREGATFYHTRLSIIDTSDASAQPFSYPGSDDLLAFNGEIFNYRELRGKMSDIRTTGDVEVLYRLLQDYGEKGLHRINGFFAFAYLDRGGNLLLARDRFGEKPLYYTIRDGRCCFASELKCLMELAGPGRINKRQLYSYLRLNYCAGRETIFEDVYRLLPGELLWFSKGKTKRKQWYQVPSSPPAGSFHDLMEDSVRLRLEADVPVGTFLSGGLDSSIVSALAAKQRPGLPSFSIGFSNDPFLDESRHAEHVAAHIGSKHHVFMLKEEDCLAHVQPFLDSIDEPFADSSALNMYILSLLSRRHIRVALSGDGADELFKGYNKHRALELSRHPLGPAMLLAAKLVSPLLPATRATRAGNLGRQVKRFAALSGTGLNGRIKLLASISTHSEVTQLTDSPADTVLFDSHFTENPLTPWMAADDSFDLAHVLSDDMLVKVDRSSMRHGLEVRSPFLDHRIVEYAMHLGRHEKIAGSAQKIPLRKTFGCLLPPETLKRRKRGFEIPLQRWLTGVLWPKVTGTWLNNELISSSGLFVPAAAEQLKTKLVSRNPGDAAARVWALVVFMNWQQKFSDYIVPEK